LHEKIKNSKLRTTHKSNIIGYIMDESPSALDFDDFEESDDPQGIVSGGSGGELAHLLDALSSSGQPVSQYQILQVAKDMIEHVDFDTDFPDPFAL
jgi:hypothetical protein